MWPDRVSNPGPLTYESGALPTALHGPAFPLYTDSIPPDKIHTNKRYHNTHYHFPPPPSFPSTHFPLSDTQNLLMVYVFSACMIRPDLQK